jgi:hypothetical protein
MTSLDMRDGNFQIDASIVAEGFGISPELLMELMRQGKITSLNEHGIDEDVGNYRLTFFFDKRRLRIVVDESGNVLQRSVVDFGAHPLPTSARWPGGRR